jgi:hypothetical protein
MSRVTRGWITQEISLHNVLTSFHMVRYFIKTFRASVTYKYTWLWKNLQKYCLFFLFKLVSTRICTRITLYSKDFLIFYIYLNKLKHIKQGSSRWKQPHRERHEIIHQFLALFSKIRLSYLPCDCNVVIYTCSK